VEYAELDKLIDDLQAAIDDSDPTKGYWKTLWALVGEIGYGFKNIRYVTREDREQAWERFQELVSQARTKSESAKRRFNERQQEWKLKEERSQRSSDNIRRKAMRSHPTTSGGSVVADIVLLPLTLIQRIIEELLGVTELDRLEEIRRELVKCSDMLKEAWNEFSNCKQNMLPGDKNEAFRSLQEARDKLNYGWQRWKEIKGELHNIKHREWEKRQREREERRVEREIKRRLFLERVEANISKLEDKLSHSRDALTRKENHLDELKGNYYGAWNDSFKERCSEWIQETEETISNIKEHIERLESWLEQERDKLR